MRTAGRTRLAYRTDVSRFARPEPFLVEVRPDRQRVLVAPHGELDLETVPAVAAEIDELLARGFEHIVIDLRATSFIDSSGVHLLIDYTRREDARITVIDGPHAVSRVFELSGVRKLLPFEAAL